jgi:hypothetical protein
LWKTASTCGCKGPENDTFIRGLKLLWLDVQEAFNETCILLFIEGFNISVLVIIDDDKLHYNIGKADTQSLKTTQHVRDNRKGFVAHTACYTAYGLPI